MRKDIKRMVAYYIRKFGTNDPFKLAEHLGVLYQIGEINCEGCYMFLKNHRYIFLNQNLSEQEMRLVMAHELGHALLHRKENCSLSVIKHSYPQHGLKRKLILLPPNYSSQILLYMKIQE